MLSKVANASWLTLLMRLNINFYNASYVHSVPQPFLCLINHLPLKAVASLMCYITLLTHRANVNVALANTSLITMTLVMPAFVNAATLLMLASICVTNAG